MKIIQATDAAHCDHPRGCRADSHSESFPIPGDHGLELTLRRFPNGRCCVYVGGRDQPALFMLDGLAVGPRRLD